MLGYTKQCNLHSREPSAVIWQRTLVTRNLTVRNIQVSNATVTPTGQLTPGDSPSWESTSCPAGQEILYFFRNLKALKILCFIAPEGIKWMFRPHGRKVGKLTYFWMSYNWTILNFRPYSYYVQVYSQWIKNGKQHLQVTVYKGNAKKKACAKDAQNFLCQVCELQAVQTDKFCYGLSWCSQ